MPPVASSSASCTNRLQARHTTDATTGACAQLQLTWRLRAGHLVSQAPDGQKAPIDSLQEPKILAITTAFKAKPDRLLELARDRERIEPTLCDLFFADAVGVCTVIRIRVNAEAAVLIDQANRRALHLEP